MTTVLFKSLDETLTPPSYMTLCASGADLRSAVNIVLEPGHTAKVRTGVALELPTWVEGQIRPRSSFSTASILTHLGTIDPDYRGEISVIFTNLSSERFAIGVNDRIAQIVFTPTVRATLTPTDSLSSTERGAGGFGSTGRG